MKTYEELLNMVKEMRESKDGAFDGRDIYRLCMFVKDKDLKKFKLKRKDVLPYKEYTEKNVLAELESDLDFAFNKALHKRGISAACMYCVIKMWNQVLGNELRDWSDDNYAQYGLPLLKATALKYNYCNPIGDDQGNEYKYSMEADLDPTFLG